MRWSCLILFAVITLGSPQLADAEKVRTNQSTKVYSRPGEQATVLLKVESGQNMTLLEQEGRWLKVRVKGRTGYVPRSKVDMADEDDIARNTRRRPFVDGRSKKRGFGGEEGPEDRIGADAVGEGQEEEPAKKKSAKKVVEEEEEVPAPKKKAAKKVVEEEEEVPAPKKKAAKKVVEEEEEAPAPKKKKKGEEEPEPKAKKKKVEEEVVDDEKTAEPEEDTRPVAHVSKKIAVYDQPSTKSEELFMVRPTDVLYPIEEKGKWTYVENSEGDSGWVQTESLQRDDGGKEEEEEDKDGDDGAPKRRRTIDIGARMGLMFITQTMRTDGGINTVPDNYNIPVQAPALSLQGGILLPVKQKLLVGADLTYDYAKTFFGGVSYDPDGTGTMPPVVTKLTLHNIGFRAAVGLDFRKPSGMALLGRIGYRYQAYLVDDYGDVMKNPAKLPQEVVQAPTLGVGFIMPRLSNKFGFDLSLDTILFAAGVKQTAGYEDGTKASVLGATLGAGLTYHLSKSFDLRAIYDIRWMSIDFGAPGMTSERGHTGTKVSRTDIFHLFTFGIVKPF